jgi:hypothetical protein
VASPGGRIFSARSGTWAGDGVIVGAPMVSAAPQPPQNFWPTSIGAPLENIP